MEARYGDCSLCGLDCASIEQDREERHRANRPTHSSHLYHRPIHHQVRDLCEDLSEGNHAMCENERLVSSIHDSSQLQQSEINKLRRELDLSKSPLYQSGTTPTNTTSSCACQQYCSTERERLARERAEMDRARMMDLLSTSLSQSSSLPHPPVQQGNPLIDNLSSELKALKNEVFAAQLGVSKTEATTATMEARVNNIEKIIQDTPALSIDQQLLTQLSQEIRSIKEELSKRFVIMEEAGGLVREPVRQPDSQLHIERLSQKVARLEEQLSRAQSEKKKAVTNLKATAKKLDVSLMSKEALAQQIELLRQEVRLAEESRQRSEHERLVLLDKQSVQETKLHQFRNKILDIDSKVQELQAERSFLIEKVENLHSQLTMAQAGEQQWRDNCDHLEAHMLECVGHDERLHAIRKQLTDIGEVCSRGRLETTQLRAELQAAQQDKTGLLNKVAELQFKLNECEQACSELKDLNSRLSSQAETSLATQRELDNSTIVEENVRLKGEVTKLRAEYNLQDQSSRDALSSANKSLIRYKAKCKQLLQKVNKISLEYEKEKTDCIRECTEQGNTITQCRADLEARHVELTVMKEANNKLEKKVACLEMKYRQVLEKYRYLEGINTESKSQHLQEQSALQTERDSVMADNHSLKQGLDLVSSQASDLLADMNSLRVQHQKDTEGHLAERSKLNLKLEKLTSYCTVLKSELAALEVECANLKSKQSQLDNESHETRLSHIEAVQELNNEIDSLKASHIQELEALTMQYRKSMEEIKEKNTQLQVSLSDEQATVRAIRLQQSRSLSDQQQLAEDDLSRSIKHSEQLQQKYTKTKKYLLDKVKRLQFKLEEAKQLESVSDSQRTPSTQAPTEQDALLKALTTEIDLMVEKMSERVDIDEFLTLPTSAGCDSKSFFADLLTKTRWLKQEFYQLIRTLPATHNIMSKDVPNCEGVSGNLWTLEKSQKLEHLY